MKRKELIRHLRAHGCYLLREKMGIIPGGSIQQKNRRTAVPRHNEIDDFLANKIISDLGIPPVK